MLTEREYQRYRKAFWQKKQEAQVTDSPEHNERQEGDEYYCPRCNKRWDVHEDAPPCQRD